MDIERKQKTMVKFGDLKMGDAFIVNLPDAPCDPIYRDCVCVKIRLHEYGKPPKYVGVNLRYNEINVFDNDKIVNKINVKLVEID